MATDTRETWLQRAVEALRPWFEEVGMPLPDKVLVGVGFSSKGLKSKKVVGECWAAAASDGGVNQIFMHPAKSDPGEVLVILLHELIHAADNCQNGHKGPFMKTAKVFGFRAPFTSYGNQTDELNAALAALADALGPYPHNTFLVGPGGKTSGPKEQKNRHIKLVAADCTECDYQVRGTRERIERYGYPRCPHGVEMIVENGG
ncbi:hypothetical protein ACFWY5_29795 [Nonomuraea sp. NPDC059007]|uniref:hypothetical protein n=1 Tax=Nonomuraea sp. NPDC059007 TaxID=3346692 RepID=UPI0036D0ADF5